MLMEFQQFEMGRPRLRRPVIDSFFLRVRRTCLDKLWRQMAAILMVLNGLKSCSSDQRSTLIRPLARLSVGTTMRVQTQIKTVILVFPLKRQVNTESQLGHMGMLTLRQDIRLSFPLHLNLSRLSVRILERFGLQRQH